MSNIKAKLKAARLPEKVISLCLRGDLLARHTELMAEIVKAQADGANSLSGPDVGDLPDQMEALRVEMEAEAVQLRMRAMSSRRWDELMREHPARANSELDQRYGFNALAFYRAAVMASVVDPEMDGEDWQILLGDEDSDGCLTDGQWDELTTAVFELNKQPASVPFSFAAWLKTKEPGSE